MAVAVGKSRAGLKLGQESCWIIGGHTAVSWVWGEVHSGCTGIGLGPWQVRLGGGWGCSHWVSVTGTHGPGRVPVDVQGPGRLCLGMWGPAGDPSGHAGSGQGPGESR